MYKKMSFKLIKLRLKKSRDLIEYCEKMWRHTCLLFEPAVADKKNC